MEEVDERRPPLTLAMLLGLISLVILLGLGIWLLIDTHAFSNQAAIAPGRPSADVVAASPSP